MNKKLLYLLCAAVDEAFDNNNITTGQAGQAFQDYWQQNFPNGCRKLKYLSALHAPSITNKTTNPSTDEIKILRNELCAAKERVQQLEKENQACLQNLNKEHQARMDAELRAEKELFQQKLPKTLLPKQKELEELHSYLCGLPQDVAQLLAPYYVRDNLLTFLVGCGQFSRLVQCWEACSKAVVSGAPCEPLDKCLRRLLALYNLASSDAPASVVELKPGDRYDYETSQRVASDGNIVHKLLLPGLRNSGGKLMHKALVQLC